MHADTDVPQPIFTRIQTDDIWADCPGSEKTLGSKTTWAVMCEAEIWADSPGSKTTWCDAPVDKKAAAKKPEVPVNEKTTAVVIDRPAGMDAHGVKELLNQHGLSGRYNCIHCPVRQGHVLPYCEINFYTNGDVKAAMQALGHLRFRQKMHKGQVLQGEDFIVRYLTAKASMAQGEAGGLLFFTKALARAVRAGYGMPEPTPSSGSSKRRVGGHHGLAVNSRAKHSRMWGEPRWQ